MCIRDSIISAMYAQKDTAENNDTISNENALNTYCEYYGFTPRETEVFEKLIVTERCV